MHHALFIASPSADRIGCLPSANGQSKYFSLPRLAQPKPANAKDSREKQKRNWFCDRCVNLNKRNIDWEMGRSSKKTNFVLLSHIDHASWLIF